MEIYNASHPEAIKYPPPERPKVEPSECVVREMTDEERERYGVEKKG